MQVLIREGGYVQQGLLKLCTPFAIDGGRGPGVIPVLRIPVRTQVDHLCAREQVVLVSTHGMLTGSMVKH